MDSSNNIMQNSNSVSFGSIRNIKIDKKLLNEYPTVAKEILDTFEKNVAVNEFTKKYDINVEIIQKNIIGKINKFIFKLHCLGPSTENKKYADILKEMFSKKDYSVKHTSYQIGLEPKKLKAFLDRPKLKYLKYHEAKEGVGRDDLGGHSAYWETKEVGKNIKKSLNKIENNINSEVWDAVNTAERKAQKEKLKAQLIENEKQRINNIPNDIKNVKDQISRMVD